VEKVGLDDERLGLGTGAGVEEVELSPLVPARVHGEQDTPRAGHEPALDGLGEVGQLLQLVRAGPGEVELHRARAVPADEHRAVVADVGRQRPADLEEVSQRRQGDYAATPAKRGRISFPYASSVSSWPSVMR
jgi:hypothetical protein